MPRLARTQASSASSTSRAEMDGLIATAMGLFKIAAVVAATLASSWALFMFGYSNPELAAQWLPRFDVVTRHLWGLGVLLALLGLSIGASTSLIARRIGQSAWALVPGLWVVACFAVLLLGPHSSSGS